jgi:hypothetical protein
MLNNALQTKHLEKNILKSDMRTLSKLDIGGMPPTTFKEVFVNMLRRGQKIHDKSTLVNNMRSRWQRFRYGFAFL